MQRKVIYTVVTGDYDTPRGGVLSESFAYIILTDNENLTLEGWDTVVVPKSDDSKKLSRELKINAHKYLPDFDVYVYIDANYEIKKDLGACISKNFKGGFLAHKHPSRKTVKAEAARIIEIGKDTAEAVTETVSGLTLAGFRDRAGLFQNGFFIRDRSADKLCEDWSGLVASMSYRDQLTLPYVSTKHADIFHSISSRFNEYLTLRTHKAARSTPPKVYYFRPMCRDKEAFGDLLNDHCANVPDNEDWICITDQDTAFLLEKTGEQIEDVIIKHGNDYELFGCLTNRLGLKHQTPNGISENGNILCHRKLAERFAEKKYDEVLPAPKDSCIGGMFMLFQKKTWSDVKFIPGIISKEDGYFFDWHFCEGVKKKGGRIGVMQGVYIFHYYRMHKRPSNYRHLK